MIFGFAQYFKKLSFSQNILQKIKKIIFRFQICWTLTWDGHWHWDRWNTIPMTTVNSALACHALTMLALCYLPGVLAAYIQIFRGTKFSRFPNWLDNWLKMRKQLGLLMLLSATIHVSYNSFLWVFIFCL